MKTFIQVVEVWVPDADGYLLELDGGLYGTAVEFGALSRRMCFGRGEGLPGRVWDAGHPILLKHLQGGYFQRAAAAKAAQLTCAVAFPVFFTDMLKAVVIFFCGGADALTGALELWRNDPCSSADMTLVDGYYGSTAAEFESAARALVVPRGSGLPGLSWQREASVFIDGLSESSTFLRAEQASTAAIQRGLAIPCPVQTSEHYVLTLLSARATPIAQRIEAWSSGVGGQSLQRTYGYCETAGLLPIGADQTTLGSGEDTIAAAFATGIPRVRQYASDEPGDIGLSAAAVGLGGMIALPIVRGATIAETVVLYF